MLTFHHKNLVKRILYPKIGRLLPLGALTEYKFYGLEFFRSRNFLKKTQKFSKKEICSYQCERLQKIVGHAYANVPFYRNQFDRLGIRISNVKEIGDLSLFPVLNKNSIKSEANELIAENSQKFQPVEWHTGGSTGKPLHFYRDKKLNAFVQAVCWRFYNWAGQRFGDRFVLMRSQLGYREGKLDLEKLYDYDPISGMLEVNTAALNRDYLKKVLNLFKEYKPLFLHSYPSIANILALFVLQNTEYKVKLNAVLVGAEFLYPEVRKNIEEAFDCRVFNFYGMEEGLVFAMECKKGNMHISPELGILEILKGKRQCNPREIGEFVCTGLQNYSMPLIRYGMGDFGCLKKEECSCGMKLPIIEIYGGREKDLLVTRSGIVNLISHLNISHNIKGIKEFQIYQENIDEVIIKVVRDLDYKEDDRNEIFYNLKRQLGEHTDIRFEFVDSIPRSRANKFKFVVSKVPINFG